MKIFLDTADLSEIRRASDAGLIDGITTNPSLVAKVADGDVTAMYREICEAVDGPVSLEVVAVDRETMVAEGRKLAAIHENAVVKPFVGRLDDISGEGMQLIGQIRQVYDNYGFDTEILAASLRHPMHVVECMLIGADCVTLPSKVLWQLSKHPLTDSGLDAFLKDWDAAGTAL